MLGSEPFRPTPTIGNDLAGTRTLDALWGMGASARVRTVSFTAGGFTISDANGMMDESGRVLGTPGFGSVGSALGRGLGRGADGFAGERIGDTLTKDLWTPKAASQSDPARMGTTDAGRRNQHTPDALHSAPETDSSGPSSETSEADPESSGGSVSLDRMGAPSAGSLALLTVGGLVMGVARRR